MSYNIPFRHCKNAKPFYLFFGNLVKSKSSKIEMKTTDLKNAIDIERKFGRLKFDDSERETEK